MAVNSPITLSADGIESCADAPVEYPGAGERGEAVDLLVAAYRQPGPADQGFCQRFAELAGLDQRGVRVGVGVRLRARAVEDQ